MAHVRAERCSRWRKSSYALLRGTCIWSRGASNQATNYRGRLDTMTAFNLTVSARWSRQRLSLRPQAPPRGVIAPSSLRNVAYPPAYVPAVVNALGALQMRPPYWCCMRSDAAGRADHRSGNSRPAASSPPRDRRGRRPDVSTRPRARLPLCMGSRGGALRIPARRASDRRKTPLSLRSAASKHHRRPVLTAVGIPLFMVAQAVPAQTTAVSSSPGEHQRIRQLSCMWNRF
jgi:hypothetical protein